MADTRKYKILHPTIHIVGESQLITVGMSDTDIEALIKTYPNASVAFEEIPQMISSNATLVPPTTFGISEATVNTAPKT